MENPSEMPASETPPDDAAQLTISELLSSNHRLSVLRGRIFVDRTLYDSATELEAALTAAKAALPTTESAYKTSGKTTPLAVVALLLSTLPMFAIVLAICGGLCIAYNNLEASIHNGSHNASRLFGWLSIFLNLALVVIMTAIPILSFQGLSWATKNRNAWLPGILAGLSTWVISVLLFVPLPIWQGETLAPTDLTFFFIPIRWLLIGIGGFLVPLFVMLGVSGTIAGQKFCEQRQVFLQRFRTLDLDFDFAENALEIFRRGEYDAIAQFPKVEGKGTKHRAQLTLWWHKSAETAFLEMEMQFKGKNRYSKKAEEKQAEWLVFSTLLDRNQAEAIGCILPK